MKKQGSEVSGHRSAKKCGNCKFWYPNTPKGVVAEAKRRSKHPCSFSSGNLHGGKTSSCRFYKGFKQFFMVPWDEKTWIKIEADSRDEMLQKVGVIAHKIAGDLAKHILMEEIKEV
jgi:hypothetical protein